jgi:hypothetical protein
LPGFVGLNLLLVGGLLLSLQLRLVHGNVVLAPAMHEVKMEEQLSGETKQQHVFWRFRYYDTHGK